MLIAIDGSRAFIDQKTGTENYSFQLISAIASSDTKNNYLIYLRKGQKSKIVRSTWPDNFSFKEIGGNHLWTQVALGLQTFKDPIDLLFVPSHTLPVISRPGLKTLLTVHDLGAEYLPELHKWKQRFYLGFMTYYQLKKATHLIAVSNATKKDIIKKVGIAGNRITVIYEGLNQKPEKLLNNPNNFSKDKNDTKSNILTDLKIEKNKYFLFVGTIQPRKNLERLIKAFSLLLNDKSLDINLVLAGGKGWLSEDIYDLPQKLGIADRVIFSGRVSDQALSILYRNAIALTFPSLFEGFGLPILEAFASKCPVITSNTSSMPEISGNAAILVNPQSVEEIMKAMKEILVNDNLRNSLIHKGSIRLKDFSWKKAALETISVFEEIAKI